MLRKYRNTQLALLLALFALIGAPVFAQGDFLWVNATGDTGADQANAVAVDASGNVLVTGKFHDMVDFGGGVITSAGNFDIFVASYDSAGNHNWSNGFGGVEVDQGGAVAVDSLGNVTVTGTFSGSVDFGGGALTAPSTFASIFIVQFDSAGNHRWSRDFGSTAIDADFGIAVDTLGNVTVTGPFSGTVDFGGGALVSAGGADIFVAQFDVDGNHNWS